jgi:hypothetical protein
MYLCSSAVRITEANSLHYLLFQYTIHMSMSAIYIYIYLYISIYIYRAYSIIRLVRRCPPREMDSPRFVQPLNHLQIIMVHSMHHRIGIQVTGRVLGLQPSQHLQVTILCSARTCPCIPWAGRILGSQLLQHLPPYVHSLLLRYMSFRPMYREDLAVAPTAAHASVYVLPSQ